MKTARRFWPPVAVMAAIFAFSAQPSSALPDFGWWNLLWETGGHAAGYALLGAAWMYALQTLRPASAAWTAWTLSLVYALGDEFHQSFVPGRTADWRDIVVDALGAALAMYLWRRHSP